MAAVWQLEMTWPRGGETFLSLVREFGGELVAENRATFARYRAAEICAQLLHQRSGRAPSLSLVLQA